MSVTHIAAPHIVIEDRWMRQRCGWCGAVLLEHDLTRVAVPVGTDPMPATWTVGAQVRVDGPLTTCFEDQKLAVDSCARNPLTLPGWS